MLAVFRLKTSHATQNLLVVVCCTLRITSYLYLGRKQPKERKLDENLHVFLESSYFALWRYQNGAKYAFVAPFSTRVVLDDTLF